MRHYRFYRIDKAGHIHGPAIVKQCDNDHEALAAGRALVDGCDIEVWQDQRVVAYLVPEKPDEP